MGKRKPIIKIRSENCFLIVQCFHTHRALLLRLDTFEQALQRKQHKTLHFAELSTEGFHISRAFKYTFQPNMVS